MNRTRKKNDDLINSSIELQEHRYDPGHFTGGNVHPVLKRGRRPNRHGYVLIIVGLFFLIFPIAAILRPDNVVLGVPWIAVVIGPLFCATLSIAAGIQLVRKRKYSPKPKNHGKQSAKRHR